MKLNLELPRHESRECMPVEDSRPRSSLLTWYAAGALAAVASGFVAARLNLWGLAPVGLLPVAVGCLLGAILGWLAAFAGVKCRVRLILGTIVLAAVTVLSEHAWLYLDFRRQWHEARATSAEVALFRPETPWSPGEYFTREASAGRWALWLTDAAIITAAAVVTNLIVLRRATKTRVATRLSSPKSSDAAKPSVPTPDT
jgi:hypothetical protein